MDNYPDIDADYAALQALEVRRDKALAACAAEQAAGRIGHVQYYEAKALESDVRAAAAKLSAAIDQVRTSL